MSTDHNNPCHRHSDCFIVKKKRFCHVIRIPSWEGINGSPNGIGKEKRKKLFKKKQKNKYIEKTYMRGHLNAII